MNCCKSIIETGQFIHSIYFFFTLWKDSYGKITGCMYFLSFYFIDNEVSIFVKKIYDLFNLLNSTI